MQFIRHLYNLIIHCVIFTVFLLSDGAYSQAIDDSWNVVRKQFKLNHQLNHPAVQKQLQWLVSHPKYITKLAQAEPYLYHIITEVKQRNLPGEIALIPMLESAYNPFAYSGAGAAGLWQLMPKTGQNLGVKGDWWVDGRRNINSSTQAALYYFSHLNRFFHGDWLLAIAAYDCGEGTIQRLLKTMPSTQRSFWFLPLPQETQIYVPRLLALAEIIANPQRYHIRLPYIPHEPYFEEVNIGAQIDLNHAAKLAGISYRDLIKLNPGFNHWTTSPNIPSKLLIPKKHVLQFHQNLSRLPHSPPTRLVRHTVRRGDSLSSIAKRFNTNVLVLAKINNIHSNALNLGQDLFIPIMQAPQMTNRYRTLNPRPKMPIAPKYYKVLHIVQNHEDLKSISKYYQITPQHLVSWNHLKTPYLRPGQHLFIWRQTHGQPYYVVKRGDTLNQIAQYNHLPVLTLKHLNPKIDARYLHPGQKLKVV